VDETVKAFELSEQSSQRPDSALAGAGQPDGLAAVWPQVLKNLEERCVDKQAVSGVRLWLGPSKVHPRAVEDGTLHLDCPTPLFGQQIRQTVSDIACRVDRHALREHRERVAQSADVQATPETKPIVRGRRGREQGFKMLRDFVVGSCNRIAYDSIMRIVEEPANPVNPLFIHGASGLGKTHLEQGLAVAFKERHPHSKVIYTTCEQFRNAYLSACEKGTSGLQAFRVKMRHADLLLVDDIHFLSRGQMVQTKEELFSTFNELAEQGKKVVITSDAHPSDIKYLEERFIQRFTGGLVVMLDRPDLQVRREVIAAKARSQGVDLPTEVVDFVADHISDNVRELEGAVNKLVAYAGSFGRAIDLAVARQALADILGRDAGEPRLKVILRAVADNFDLSVEDVLGKGRAGARSTARHIAMYVLKACSSDTYAAVGNAFGIKSHSTVTYACEQVAKYRATDENIDRFIDDLLLRVRRS
jgi:chromosomal replication initiator protein